MDLLDEKTAYVGELLSDLLLLEMLLIPAFFLPCHLFLTSGQFIYHKD